LLQGSRLTAWELKELGIPVRLLCDSAAGALLESGRVGAVIVGADRITSNGDVANKIGTYSLAILAHFHNVPFFVAAPFSSFDMTIASGKEIIIEQRQSTEVTRPMDVQAKRPILFGFLPSFTNILHRISQAAPHGVEAFNPAFDVTPARLIHAIITERGVVHPVTGL
jgi:methylthioribose-1-phosphate isomerase